MERLSLAAQSIWAKKSKTGSSLWLPLAMHLADSAALAQKLWNLWVPDGVKQAIAAGIAEEGSAEQLFIFLAAAHDIGKATPVFQAKNATGKGSDLDECIEEKLAAAGLPMRHYHFTRASKTPHALATHILLKHAGCDTNIAVILGAHHGKPPGSITLNQCGIGSYGENYYLGKEGKSVWSAVQREFIDFALDLAGIAAIEEIPRPNMAAQVLLSGLVIMTDWIASNESYFPYIRPEDESDFLSAKARAKTAWKRLDLPDPWDAGNTWMNADLYRERFTFAPNEIQSAVAQAAAGIHAPGIIVLEAPMGTGKTEAALVAAEVLADKAKRKGVFFALPTQATSDGIFPRMLNWIDKLDDGSEYCIRLMHGKAQFNEEFQALFEGSKNVGEDEDGGVFVHEWFEGQKKSMLADFVVGTIDQLLLAALKHKHVMLRHLGLANKIVVIDECHAYDAYMSRYLDRALRWLGAYHVPVIVLSATLSTQKRQMVIDAYLNPNSSPRLPNDPLGRSNRTPVQPPERIACRDYPLITYTDGSEVKHKAVVTDGISREVCLDFLTDDALLDKLDDLLSGGGCAGVIVNTVKRAQGLAQALREQFGKETVRLLHSRFLAPDRAEKERELLKELGKPSADRQRPAKRIVIGTQVLEQSLDIDFDVLVTDICPMDMLLQRIGRLHRHERTRPEKLRTALCLILAMDGDGFEAGAKAIYSEYLLMRTKALLPQRLALPQDIPVLVQDTYDDSVILSSEPPGYREAKEQWNKMISRKEERADKFRICPPWPDPGENLVDWLNTDVPASDKHGEAAVRDSEESFEVLLVWEKDGGRLCFPPWREGGRELPKNEKPDEEIAKALARQSVRLPRVFCAPWAIDKTIKELEHLNRERLREWQESPWLKGELFLILDEKCSVNLCGYRLTYDQYDGLLYEKEA